ncbi:uncharacterized protein GLRG_01730 [Colletotrichum graminicola M1.001]|uniref:Uncharacterized protein n=1 Tax=Colletotrichum graminicola (strain M1.001 / M2 / FGSC 10212) TaxID=645133 RepID=E3Q956_COLGM|nr:uncharacterized protein GLRG_01730 [Colletotrichum graminicola M1.001]EFQ27235.1 hypothetical protein GLRG_01730 [Colletotrichum graminicola M1.001]
MFEMLYNGYLPCSSDKGDASLIVFKPKLKIDTTRDIKIPSGALNSSRVSATAGKGIEGAIAL